MHPSLSTTASPAAAAFDESDLVRLLTPTAVGSSTPTPRGPAPRTICSPCTATWS